MFLQKACRLKKLRNVDFKCKSLQLVTLLTTLSLKLTSSSSSTAADGASRDLKNFFGFGAPDETSFVDVDVDVRFKSTFCDGRIDEKLPHFPTTPDADFDAAAEVDRQKFGQLSQQKIPPSCQNMCHA